MDLRTDENPTGTFTTPATLYKAIMDVRTFGFFSATEPALQWRMRNWARDGATLLIPSTIKAVKEGVASLKGGLLSRLAGGVRWGLRKVPVVRRVVPAEKERRGSLRWYGNSVANEMIKAGKTVEEAAEICWLTAVGAVGAPVSMVCRISPFFSFSVWSGGTQSSADSDSLPTS